MAYLRNGSIINALKFQFLGEKVYSSVAATFRFNDEDVVQ